jgi:acyl-coenzyme A thioesterase PaaI-like protein
MTQKSIQETYAPNNICFGCGVANPNGLRIRSFVEGDRLVANFLPGPHHQAYQGMLNGGIIGTLLDCNSAWTAAWHLMEKQQLDSPPCVVTAEYTIKMMLPTPATHLLRIEGWVVKSGTRSVTTSGSITADGKVTATCDGIFVAVKEGHPAWHRW